jgi:hypothetical protein
VVESRAVRLGALAALACSCTHHDVTGSGGAPAPSSDEAGVVVTDGSAPSGPGHVVFRLPDDHWHSLLATPGSAPSDLTSTLDQLSPGGTDQGMSLSFDGAFVAVDATSRFSCSGGGDCAVWARVDGAAGGDVRPGGVAQGVPSGRPAVASGGRVVVYPKTTRANHDDLVAVTKTGDAWGPEVVLTAAMPFDYAHDPSFSPDGTRVAFDCGPSPYQDVATSICEAAVDGSSFRVAVSYKDGPYGADGGDGGDWTTHHPAYAPDGALVFEADWGPDQSHDEQIWRKPPDGAPARVSTDAMPDDNSPCVLPDGRIASLWLGRVEPDGAQNALHEIKVMNADGSDPQMILTDVDVVDVGLTCGE